MINKSNKPPKKAKVQITVLRRCHEYMFYSMVEEGVTTHYLSHKDKHTLRRVVHPTLGKLPTKNTEFVRYIERSLGAAKNSGLDSYYEVKCN